MQGAPVSSWLPTSKETLIRPYTVKSNGLWGAGGCLTSEGTAGPVGVGFCGGVSHSAGVFPLARAKAPAPRADKNKGADAETKRHGFSPVRRTGQGTPVSGAPGGINKN